MEGVVLFIYKGHVQHLVRTATNVAIKKNHFAAVCCSENLRFSKKTIRL